MFLALWRFIPNCFARIIQSCPAVNADTIRCVSMSLIHVYFPRGILYCVTYSLFCSFKYVAATLRID